MSHLMCIDASNAFGSIRLNSVYEVVSFSGDFVYVRTGAQTVSGCFIKRFVEVRSITA